ncbi:CueP family metal-binding protein [Ornithinibacillus bavariensis]|uniref:Lipoprotein n=1 Tax=Ornithinibacillus bavariensis TaxID=545502 RepID=A0A920C686_9BACI|nr:CueP family metal-binding protein [Ornithinibacillus bavariensis]GIO25437.1 hypothetical protein J43TS3_00480 [Ornithinibacillus bavariensis]
MKKSLLAITSILLFAILAACSDSTSNEDGSQNDIKKLVNDYSVGNYENVNASITSTELIVTDKEEKKTTYALPENEFFVSIAPFENETHPCAIHSLTGCQGELAGKEFEVFIEDDDGNVIVDQKMASLQNGFIDLWLPRDKTFEVKIGYNGKTAESTISTFENDNTCITTMQLL